MDKVYTFPDSALLGSVKGMTPDYMRPNGIPFAAFGEAWLTDEQCNSIIERFLSVESYMAVGCGATTRECPRPLEGLDCISEFGIEANQEYFGYELDSIGAWMQTYTKGDSYQLHMDSEIGQSRKMSAVAFLSDEEYYDGGELVLYVHPYRFVVPKTQGTIVVFHPWMLHEVTGITRGVRQTINMGFWGPSFR